MLGQTNEWFFHDLAGIQPDPKRPGFKQVIVRPQPCGNVTSLTPTYAGPYGTTALAWQTTAAGLETTVTVPPNSTAVVSLPGNAEPFSFEAGTHRVANGAHG